MFLNYKLQFITLRTVTDDKSNKPGFKEETLDKALNNNNVIRKQVKQAEFKETTTILHPI